MSVRGRKAIAIRPAQNDAPTMMRLGLILLFLSGMPAPATGATLAQLSAVEKRDTSAAEQAARDWLRHVDTGAWAAAWKALAPGVRDTVSQTQWTRRASARAPMLGNLRSRRLIRAQPRDSLPQVPKAGPVVVLRYHSTYGTDLYVETLLVVQTREKGWQVAGYEVAPVAGRSGRTEGP
ncbi:MAG: DUF4019 domain-containing protein [Salinibacter sp.]